MGKKNTSVSTFIYASAITLFILIMPAQAGPFIKISGIDAQNDYPRIAVTITVQNVDKNFISGLDEGNLMIYEDGYRVNYVKVTDISGSEDLLYLVFSIDSSKSISREFLGSIRKSARDIVDSTGSHDKIAIYRFNDDVKLMNNFTSNRLTLVENINAVERHGTKTMLYNAIYDSLQLLGDIKTQRKAVIVFTDGKDEGSSIKDSDIVTCSHNNGIPIYVITMKSSPSIQSLGRIAKLSGGKLIFSNRHEDVVKMYQSILSMIKSRYLILYQTITPADGREHKMEVRLNYGNLKDRDMRSFTLPHDTRLLNIFKDQNTILLLLIVFLLIIIIITLTYFFSHGKKSLMDRALPSQQLIQRPLPDDSDEKIRLEEAERLREEETITAHDPSFTYSDAWLIQKEGPETGKKFPLYWDETLLGRAEDNSIKVADMTISPHHAKIKCIRDAYYLFDMVSDSGTFLNGHKLLRPKILYDWDEIRIGKTHFIFRGSKIGRETS